MDETRDRIVFHIDVNSAYLSWTAVEELKNGGMEDIRMIPAIIGGNQESRHGVVLAKSMPAKKYGINTGEPVANALRKCPNLVMRPPQHKLYEEYSHKLMAFLYEYTPDIEQASVDECYLEYTGIAYRYHSPVEAAVEIKDAVYKKFGFTVNIGISSNKLLAKMASDFTKPNKVHTLFLGEIQEKMWPMKVSELYMAGRASVATLKKLEINTIGDLAKADPKLLEIHLKSHGRTLWEFANGMDCALVKRERVEAKGIGNSTTLAEDVVTVEGAQKVLLWLAQSVGKRLRESEQKAGMVSVEIKYHTFLSVSHQMQLTQATASDDVLYKTACVLFKELWNQEPIRLLGVRTSKLLDRLEPEQLSLFDIPMGTGNEEKHKRHKRAEEAVDALNKKYGDGVITRGTF